jgi:hypothetical protein
MVDAMRGAILLPRLGTKSPSCALLSLGKILDRLDEEALERLENLDVMMAPYNKRYLYNNIKLMRLS